MLTSYGGPRARAAFTKSKSRRLLSVFGLYKLGKYQGQLVHLGSQLLFFSSCYDNRTTAV